MDIIVHVGIYRLYGLFYVASLFICNHRYVNALFFLLDWKFLISLGIASRMHVDHISKLSWKIVKVIAFLMGSYLYYLLLYQILVKLYELNTIAV